MKFFCENKIYHKFISQKDILKVKKIGELELDSDEEALLKLPPKFAVRRRLCSIEMKTDLEMGVLKVRYQIHKEEDDKDSKDAEYKEDIGNDTNENKRRRVLTKDEKRNP